MQTPRWSATAIGLRASSSLSAFREAWNAEYALWMSILGEGPDLYSRLVAKQAMVPINEFNGSVEGACRAASDSTEESRLANLKTTYESRLQTRQMLTRDTPEGLYVVELANTNPAMAIGAVSFFCGVNPKSHGGQLSPPDVSFTVGQIRAAIFD